MNTNTENALNSSWNEIDLLSRFQAIRALEELKSQITQLRNRHFESMATHGKGTTIKAAEINAEINEDAHIIHLINLAIEHQKSSDSAVIDLTTLLEVTRKETKVERKFPG